LSFALAFALVIGGFFALLAVVAGEPSTVQTLLVSLIGSQVGLATGALAYLRWRGEPLGNIGIAVPGLRGVILVVVGTFGTLVLAIAVGLLVQFLGISAAENATAGQAAEVPSSLLLLIPVAIFVIGPCEELLFRGVVQRRLREVWSAPVAIVLASALFAAAHVVALVGDPAAIATTIGILFVPALVFGVLYEYTKNVVVTALVHGLYDAVLFALLYVAAKYGPENPEGSQAILDPQWVVEVLAVLL
jgi:membrane protease YdiL (CAAX protease family)